MPYIPQSRRDSIALGAVNSGELNYAITQLLNGYIRSNGLRYSTINDMIGALEGAKLELYRRIAASYEDDKIKQNGDVYDVD